MIAFMFWNIGKKSILDRVARIANRHKADILVLAECEAEPDAVVAALNQSPGARWEYPTEITPSKLKVFSHLVPGSRAFFNPMWRFMTDSPGKPSGTYHFRVAKPINHFWYTLDQVLVRPDLADKLVSVDIIDTDGIQSLVTPSGWPDAENASDHLPILAVLDV